MWSSGQPEALLVGQWSTVCGWNYRHNSHSSLRNSKSPPERVLHSCFTGPLHLVLLQPHYSLFFHHSHHMIFCINLQLFSDLVELLRTSACE
jgi:hypothetical protein